jgi:EAL domain-containing protein (putative c-di-GMP-specific phosphodiesterase class I)
VVGLEALVRWQHPERGLLVPVEFLPLVENTPAIVDIGDWVLNEALRQMSEWLQAGQGWPVSINVAARQLMQADFITNLSAALLHHPQVLPGWLTLEILETSAMDDLAQVSATVREAHSLGVHCSLDDFGTGYSSLSYLKELPVHEIKIDQSFVRDMLDDAGDLALVEGVISLGQVFGRQIVAEGMETPEHGVLLVRLGCQVAQGWAIARPMPAPDVAAWVAGFKPNPLWQQWGGVPWDLNDIPLLVARRDHLKWVEQVMAAVDGHPLRLTPDELALHTHCRFGQWYQGAGRLHYRHLSAFKAIDPVHCEVHRLGREIVRLRDAGQMQEAQIAAQSLLTCKTRMLRHLDQLQSDVLTQDHV